MELMLKVNGMTCAMCLKTIEAVLGEVSGVLDVSVNLGAERARMSYDLAS